MNAGSKAKEAPGRGRSLGCSPPAVRARAPESQMQQPRAAQEGASRARSAEPDARRRSPPWRAGAGDADAVAEPEGGRAL